MDVVSTIKNFPAISTAVLGSHSHSGRLLFDVDGFAEDFNRRPLHAEHNLHELDLFSADSLAFLSKRYSSHPDDYFVAGSAPTPGTPFYSVPHGAREPQDVLATLADQPSRLLLKRPENYDPRFRMLLDSLFEQIVSLQPTLRLESITRLESAIFISSAATTTPFHFDPEIAFFSQIEGEKIYHVYAPAVLSETELENFYVHNVVNIGQVDLANRDPAMEQVFKLRPGFGLHQPQNAPHWVETGGSRSVSYSFVFETKNSRATGRARSFNHTLRRLGLNPIAPGTHPRRDDIKAIAMKLALPARRRIGKLVRSTMGR